MCSISVTILLRSFGSVGLLLSSELAELYRDSVRVLDVGVAAAGLLHLLDYWMALFASVSAASRSLTANARWSSPSPASYFVLNWLLFS